MNITEYYKTQLANAERVLAEVEQQEREIEALLVDLRGEVKRFRQKLEASTNGHKPHTKEPTPLQARDEAPEVTKTSTIIQVLAKHRQEGIFRKQLLAEVNKVWPDLNAKYLDAVLSRLRKQGRLKTVGKKYFLVDKV